MTPFEHNGKFVLAIGAPLKPAQLVTGSMDQKIGVPLSVDFWAGDRGSWVPSPSLATPFENPEQANEYLRVNRDKMESTPR